MTDLMDTMTRHARAVEAVLDTALAGPMPSVRLRDAMRHAVFAGGKRMRPFLVIESAALFGVTGDGPLRVAAALEAVHCYSLIHDDLPAMDDDDLRRGKPTVHRAFDEATAILAGDGLLTLAFALLADKRTARQAGRCVKLIADLSRAAGVAGMVGGQMLDLAAEGRFSASGKPKKLGLSAIAKLQALKTGALIAYAAEAGATLAARATRDERRALATYGKALGLAFQIKDDLLDLEGSVETLGKAVAKDEAAGKATMAGLMGVEAARALLASTSNQGIAALRAVFGEKSATLEALMRFNAERTH